MVATVYIEEANGGTNGNPATHTRVDGQSLNGTADIQFCTADLYAPNGTYPCILPSSNYYYSFWKHIFLAIKDTNYTTIDNINFYSDGSIDWFPGSVGADRGLWVGKRGTGDNGCPMDASYETPDGTLGLTGSKFSGFSTGHGYYDTSAGNSRVNVNTYTVGSELLIDSGPYSGVVDDCRAAVLQAQYYSDTNRGIQSNETLTFVYDEI